MSVQDAYCVVLTGDLEPGADASTAWDGASKLLGLEAPAFESDILGRAPLVLAGEGRAAEMESRAARLRQCGVSAVCLKLGAPMVRIRRGGRLLGPVPQPFALRVLREGDAIEPDAAPGAPPSAAPGPQAVPPPPLAVWLSRAGTSYGPYTLGQLRGWLQEGSVSRMDFASTDGTAWVPLGSLLGSPAAPALVARESSDEATIRRIAEYERISAIVWTVIAVVQILTLVAIIAGLWNLYAAWTRFRIVPHIHARNCQVPEAFESITGLVVIGLINLFLGGVVGVVGIVLDFVVRDHVLKNRHLFDQVSEEQLPV
ncbi:hypothetical protein [Arenimonas caeni]|jgi:hypothetical protein|uniref:hypothetical protein n=1 Tax=Arenimonas caeni TaxID=2058085 RepID=UPI002A36C12B|nr:hypothetical protein [Arenimonas caeni]MDY0022693.1 hypothetical protein [Arenimonas caeni]